MSMIENRHANMFGRTTRRETVTAAAAIGFLAGGGARMVTDLGNAQSVVFGAFLLSLGAIAAAVLAGIVIENEYAPIARDCRYMLDQFLLQII